MLLYLAVLLLLVSSVRSSRRSQPCADFGLNWAAEIRCLRNMLSQCHPGNAFFTPEYYELPEYSATQKFPDSTTSTTTTTTSAPPPPAPTAPPLDLEAFRNELANEFTNRIRELESKVDLELRAMEERSNRKIEDIKRKSENEIKKLNKTVKLMTRRVYRFGSAEYIYMDEKESWYGAEEQCVRWGGHLASIADARENFFVRGIHNYFVWIGLNDIQAENRYVWTDGTYSPFKNWKHGQPDNAEHNENCAEMGSDGQWADTFCLVARHFVCKRT